MTRCAINAAIASKTHLFRLKDFRRGTGHVRHILAMIESGADMNEVTSIYRKALDAPQTKMASAACTNSLNRCSWCGSHKNMVYALSYSPIIGQFSA
jgi:DNA-binding FrmR family transcriptional regulator